MSDNVVMTAMNYDSKRPAAANPVKIMDLSLRDGHQSLFATRGRTEDMIPVAEMMDEVGFWALETWGGATFDTMHRFLNEDPWERLRTLKRYAKKTPFSMLLRAQNLVGYRNYADDVATAFVDRAAENGMDIFRTFDALNDYRNFRNGGQTDQEERQALPGLHVLHADRAAPRWRRLQPRLLRRQGQRARGYGRRLDLHQGHGGNDRASTTSMRWSKRSRR